MLFQKRNAWIASSFGDFDEGNAKKTKQVNIDHSFKKGKYLQFLYGLIAYYKQQVVPWILSYQQPEVKLNIKRSNGAW